MSDLSVKPSCTVLAGIRIEIETRSAGREGSWRAGMPARLAIVAYMDVIVIVPAVAIGEGQAVARTNIFTAIGPDRLIPMVPSVDEH
jgi:hypothetical protein